MPSEAKNMTLLDRGPVGLDCADEVAALAGSVGATTIVNTNKREKTCQNLFDIFSS
jgi:hypothetical protein